jgi:hypothetical protein
MGLKEEIASARASAQAYAEGGEELVGVVPAEPAGMRVYICAFERNGEPAWIALDVEGAPVTAREVVRDAVSMAALCELAEESAGGGDLAELRSRLSALRAAENPEGIEEAEAAAAELEQAILEPPRVASITYLDSIGRSAARLEEALGSTGGSPFAAAMKSGLAAADELATTVERFYKVPLNER